MDAINLLIAVDIDSVRRELRTVLELAGQEIGMEICVLGEANNGQEAAMMARDLRPDVVIIDLEMSVMDGITSIEVIKSFCPSIQVLVLSIHDDQAMQQRAGQAGADGFIVKGSPVSEIIQHIKSFTREEYS